MLLFDHLIPISKAKEDILNIEKSISGMGMKIRSVDYDYVLRLNGEKIQNKLRNKMVLTLVRRRVDEEVFSPEISRKFLDFFDGRVIDDPVEPLNPKP